MESFFDASVSTLERFVDESAMSLVGITAPNWYINSNIKVVFANRANWDAVVATAPLSLAAGLAEVLSSDSPPNMDFFRSLMRSVSNGAVYAVVLEKPGSQSILYIGSGTNACAYRLGYVQSITWTPTKQSARAA